MTLLSRLREKRTGNLATAIPAISATQPKGEAATVARIATVAVANPSKGKPARLREKRTEALQCSATRTKIELDAALAVLLEQGRVTLVIDRLAHRIVPTAAILADGWGRK